MPAGYQLLIEKPVRSRSLLPSSNPRQNVRRRALSESSKGYDVGKTNLTKDKLGRKKIRWPRSGPLTVQLYPSRAIESTNVMHVKHLVNYLHEIMKTRPVYNVVAIADGGPDWSVKGMLNLMSLGYLWKNLKLDVLVVQCYAPGHSRFNPIERSWSQLTNWLVGVILPDDLNGRIPKDSDNEAWDEVLDNAVKLCAKFWDKKFYAGFRIRVEEFLTTNPIIPKLKSTHQLLHEFTNASKKKIRESAELSKLQQDYQFFVRHVNRKAYQIEFVRCDTKCCSHCTALPQRDNKLLNTMRMFGGTCPSPEESQFYDGHYRTFLDIMRSARLL